MPDPTDTAPRPEPADPPALVAGCRRCGSDDLRVEFGQVNGRREMIRLICNNCGAKGKRRDE